MPLVAREFSVVVLLCFVLSVTRRGKIEGQSVKFEKISKRNLPNLGMGGWMVALADKVHK